MNRVVMFSGGVGSWMAAKRVAAEFGTDDLTLLFLDTLMEDEDLYRFVDEAATDIGGTLITVTEGRTPWEVFNDKRFLGNTRVDLCSRVLKREPADQWIERTFDPSEVVVYVGIDWTEAHRFERLTPRKLPYIYEAPLLSAPYLTKADMLDALTASGIEPPRLYGMGFPHNNCGGFCVKAGMGHFKLLLEKMPERYAEHEQREREIRSVLGDVAIMRDRSGGTTRPLTMEELRLRIQNQGPVDEHDFGGCGCFADDG